MTMKRDQGAASHKYSASVALMRLVVVLPLRRAA
jgi:hypothetical protein